MSDIFTIYIDRLKSGHTTLIEETIPSDFLGVEEKDLQFTDPVKVKGETYLADDHLILHFKIETSATLPCSACNEKFKLPVIIDNFYHAEPIKELKTGVFDYKEALREAILLQVPPFAECHGGKCPERESIAKFLKPSEETEGKKPEKEKPVVYFPFQDLD